MKTLTKLIPVALLALSSSVHAQEPVVGVANPESLFVDEDPLLHKNKQATLHIMRELLQCNQWDRAREWMTEQYIQHNPNAASGVEGVIYYFTQVLKREPTENCGELKTPVVAVMAEDDLVTVMMPRTYPHPTKEGETYTTTWYDTFRFVDGKADEHWDPATIPAP